MYYLKVKVSLPDSMLESRGLMKLGILSDEDLDFYLWLRSLDTKLAVYSSMELVAYMDI